MYLLNLRKIKTNVGLVLIFTLLGIGLFSMPMMHSGNDMGNSTSSLTCGSQDCPATTANLPCLSHCINILQSFTKTTGVNFGFGLSILLLLIVSFAKLFGLVKNNLTNYKFFKPHLWRLFRESLVAFYNQIGFWLALVEKKDFISDVERVKVSRYRLTLRAEELIQV